MADKAGTKVKKEAIRYAIEHLSMAMKIGLGGQLLQLALAIRFS